MGVEMVCATCGAENFAGAVLCSSCGASVATESQAATLAIPSQPENPAGVIGGVRQVRPWVRYWARMLDLFLASIVATIILTILAPHALDHTGASYLFSLAVFFVWVFVESFLLSSVGTTPGKWFFKTRLVPPSGNKPSYSKALSRSFKVWWRGLGIGFPIISLVTLIIARGDLKEMGVSTWDKDTGFHVVHNRIGALRTVVAVLFVLVFIALSIFGALAIFGSVANA
jgi:uncharacterized RDD family membrane protein YckC